MNNKTKIILTIIGLAAVVVPAILLIVFSGNKGTSSQTTPSSGTRQIDPSTIQKGVENNSRQAAPATPAPLPASPPAIIQKSPSPTPNLQGTPSGVN